MNIGQDMQKDILKVLISEEEISARVKELVEARMSS